ncbi:hypothetical protein DACRYDRAFT_105655 [Dacryopinax primogenitus]|uniref:BTB domain-containing protein n=1 Tax=Dacryopinax primogenitus (strain DJM 731) TaxID=1858805 RepID=M5GEQ9_DACPD|nr:uncharacterized protein DACRYDRAFT_105655 [Dacryopinax primogenitus]EJU03493.1 hypothetical protein DACRYDRAFT_105655 [Dacryopinax primogenitus]
MPFTLTPALKSTADIILCCSDGVQFVVHSAVIRYASASFAETYDLPAKVEIEHLRVNIYETSSVMDFLLSKIYGLPPSSEPTNIDILIARMKVASTFNMHEITNDRKVELLGTDYLYRRPLDLLAIGMDHHLPELVGQAIEQTFKLSEDKLLNSPMQILPANVPSRLLTARHDRARAIHSRLEGFISGPNREVYGLPTCPRCQSTHPWLVSWIAAVKLELLDLPTTSTIFSPAFVNNVQDDYIQHCDCRVDANTSSHEMMNKLKAIIDPEFPIPTSWDF